jgi:hypothetical protein
MRVLHGAVPLVRVQGLADAFEEVCEKLDLAGRWSLLARLDSARVRVLAPDRRPEESLFAAFARSRDREVSRLARAELALFSYRDRRYDAPFAGRSRAGPDAAAEL